MYNYIYYKNKRLALGLSVNQVAEEAGVSTLTLDEAKKLQPHTKALVMLMREMASKHQLKRMDNKLDDLAMFITGEVKRIDEEE